MTLQKRLEAFAGLGDRINRVLSVQNPDELSGKEKQLFSSIADQQLKNPWFTKENVIQALAGIRFMLQMEKLEKWASCYPEQSFENNGSKTVAVIMAGNIPLVGFHDFMCVLVSGHSFLGKLSEKDSDLPVILSDMLAEILPELADRVNFTTEVISDFDAIIATGSNNTARYFEYYFGKYKNIIRKNRSSVAVLTGEETQEQIKGLGNDIFSFFGLGCRNVSKLYVPAGFDPVMLFQYWDTWDHLKMHNKYMNNYDYQKAIMLVESIKHFDNGFCLMRTSTSNASPVSVIHYEHYNNLKSAFDLLEAQKEQLQCVVSATGFRPNTISVTEPGMAQFPSLSDYADGVDTIRFLSEI